ncbi:hypothetical protein, partial [Streptomyces sp. NPDC046909]|uniref:hypothetical protein n=1 Tax=Streptomyces sp. NPDC046909 TaxID=3155617 RepID=UPI0033D5026F
MTGGQPEHQRPTTTGPGGALRGGGVLGEAHRDRVFRDGCSFGGYGDRVFRDGCSFGGYGDRVFRDGCSFGGYGDRVF